MKKSHIIGLVFIVVALGAIISTVYKADTYASFNEAREHPGREFHIIGELVSEMPVEENIVGTTLVLSFYLKDSQGNQCKVVYLGAKPQDFEKSDQVVLIGKFVDDEFLASSLLLKCPSKYSPDDLKPLDFETTVITGDQ